MDASLTQSRGEVNQDAYLVLFSELVSYCRNRVQSVTELEQKLADLGYRIGRRSLDLIAMRERAVRREITLLNILNFVSLSLWKFLFGKQADSLKKVRNHDECTSIERAREPPICADQRTQTTSKRRRRSLTGIFPCRATTET